MELDEEGDQLIRDFVNDEKDMDFDEEGDQLLLDFIRDNPEIDQMEPDDEDELILEFLSDNPNIDRILECYMDNYDRYICDRVRTGPIVETHNFQLSGGLISHDMLTRQIYQTQTFTFKVNASCGVILQNTRTQELRYYYPCWNNAALFEEAVSIHNRADWTAFLDTLSTVDYIEEAANRRENTEWIVVWVTNITFYIFHRDRQLLGASPTNFPRYLKNNEGLITFATNRGKPFRDNLCLFRCLAAKQGTHHYNCERKAEQLMTRFRSDYTKETFPGVSVSDLDEIEQLFKVNVTVFSLEKNREDEREKATLVRRSIGQFESTMYLNVYEGHFSYITDLRKYAKAYSCSKCDKQFDGCRQVWSHYSRCQGAETQHHFKGGVYSPSPTLRQLLVDYGFTDLPQDLQYHPHRIVFDIESYFPDKKRASTTEPPSKLIFEDEHVPLSISICSNVAGFTTPQCLITKGDSQELVDRMMAEMLKIQRASTGYLQTVAQPVIDEIDRRLETMSDEEACEHPLKSIKGRLYGYLQSIPVIGFSSGRYDLNCLKKYLLKYFSDAGLPEDETEPKTEKKKKKKTRGRKRKRDEEEEEEPHNMIIKKTNQFLMLANAHLKFLDIQNYLPPGYSYSNFILAYECSLQKSFFPYQYVTSLDVLDEPQLPPREAFYTDLKGTTISQEEYDECLRIWEEEGMSTFRDWLCHYNNLDTLPMVEALEKQTQYFREQGFDMFYDGVSLPGLTDRILHQNKDSFFITFDEKHKDLYYALRDSVCGGPAIVFTRHHERDKTYIRSTDPSKAPHKLCKTIEGFDQNSMYLKCLSEALPVGFFHRRRAKDNFVLESNYPEQQSEGCYEWLSFLAATEQRNIRHAFNSGREQRIGGKGLRVDGYEAETKSIFEYDGCYWHGHDCYLTRKMKRDLKQERAKKTLEKHQYLKSLGYKLYVMKECQWKNFKTKHAAAVAPHLPTKRKTGPAWNKGALTEDSLKDMILSGDLFGMVEVDIEVPDHLKDHCSEFCPIFKNTMVSREDLGPYMKQFCEDSGLLKQSRRCLISSYFAKKTFFITPLLKWYLQKGLKITKIYQVVQYEAAACFEGFAKQVTAARRNAAVDPKKAMIAFQKKLEGNSAYGRTLMRKDRHTDTIITDAKGAAQAVDSPYFKHMVQLDGGYYEVEFRKQHVSLDLPIQIGIFVYGRAKLKLLQFYYDFLDFYVDRRDFEVITCDTDSLYFALSADKLEDVIKPDKRDDFFRHRDEWLPTLQCTQHKSLQPTDTATTSTTVKDMASCCTAAHRHQNLEPGLWKQECKADKILSLAPKSYICASADGKDKISCKGVQKRINPLTFQQFHHVLETRLPQMVTNRGFRLDRNNVMRSYTQPKKGLSYLYTKRKLTADGIHTTPLDL